MSLKNLMEEKQLDFNRPLLSVRRFSSTVSTAEVDNKRKNDNASHRVPPVYQSELRSGPVRNPGTVPFVWEQSPGKPKYESKKQPLALEQPPAAPKLPPGRILNADKQALDKFFEGTAVGESETRNGLFGSYNVPSIDKNEVKEESSRDGMVETDVLGSVDDDEYVDAIDTLSRSESFFLNCSISGVSGLDGPDVKTSGTFLTDIQTRDFMMDRFLPAAKAMASETPQYSIRKQPVVQEQPRKANKMLTVEKRYPIGEGRRLSNVPHCPHCNGAKETEDEDGDYDEPENSSLNVCGLFPRLCLQNSFCILNPVPGMRKQIQAPMFSSHMTTVKSSYAACCTENVNQHNNDAVHKQVSNNVLQTKGMPEDKVELKSKSNKASCRNYDKKFDGSSLYRRLQGNGSSPYHDKVSHSAVDEEKGFLGIHEKPKDSRRNGFSANAKGGKPFRELLANESNERESASASPLVEKTLYIDSVHMLNHRISNSSSSDMKGISKYRRDVVIKNREVEETALMDSSFQDNKPVNALSEKANSLPDSLQSTDSVIFSLPDKSMHDIKIVLMDGSKHEDPMGSSIAPARAEADDDGKIDLESKLGKVSGNFESSLGIIQDPIKMTSTKVADSEKINGCYSLLPIPPPFPKSPSESWLKRALPAVSSKQATSRSPLGMDVYPRLQAPKGLSPDTKWETIVKTTNVQHGHLRFSEELLTPIPEV